MKLTKAFLCGLAISITTFEISAASLNCPFCKASPGSPNWPRQKTWNALNETLGGVLLSPLPPAVVCDQKNLGAFNEEACAAVGNAWPNSRFHASDPVSIDWPNWVGDSCLPTSLYNGSAGCDVSKFPRYVVNASTSDHIVEAVKFASRNDIRVDVKGTGHDFLGRSASQGFLIWTHHLLGMEIHSSFSPQSCMNVPAVPAMTISAGQRMEEIYTYAATRGLTIVGGADGNVGIGGYLTGAGHSALSNKYGLAADNVLEMNIVTPNGDFIVTSDCQNSDLFWAMRGGGGATFGVLVSATVKTYPMPSISFFSMTYLSTTEEATIHNNSHWYEGLSDFYTKLPQLSDQGVVGYIYTGKFSLLTGSASTTSANQSVPSSDSGPEPMLNVFYGGMLGAGLPGDPYAVMDPILASLNKTGGTLVSFNKSPDVPLIYVFGLSSGAVGINSIITSRLWDLNSFSNQTSLQNTLRAFEDDLLIGHLVSGPGVRDVPSNVNSANPAWRKAYMHMVAGLSFPFHNATAHVEAASHLTGKLGVALRHQAPDSGCYLNEADINEPKFREAFWGAHYPRLLSIKRRVDPLGVLWCPVCVGSEDWREVGVRG